MKKAMMMLVACLFVATGYCDWVLIERQQATSASNLTFTNIFSDTYEDYMIVVDMMEPLSGHADVVMQFSYNGGSSWISTYSGGISSFGAGDTAIRSLEATSKGIPLTDVAPVSRNDGGYYFVGKIHISNIRGSHNYGSMSVSGVGNLGPANAHACIYGSCDALAIDSVRFVSDSAFYPTINRASVTIYGLTEY